MDLLLKELRLTFAIKALKNNLKLTFWYAATIYNVPLIILSTQRDSRLIRRDIPVNSYKFTDLEEKTII